MQSVPEDRKLGPATIVSIHRIAVRGTFGITLKSTLATAQDMERRVSRMLRIYLWVSTLIGIVLTLHLAGKSLGLAVLSAIITLVSMTVIDKVLHFIQKLHENFVALHKASTMTMMELKSTSPSP